MVRAGSLPPISIFSRNSECVGLYLRPPIRPLYVHTDNVTLSLFIINIRNVVLITFELGTVFTVFLGQAFPFCYNLINKVIVNTV